MGVVVYGGAMADESSPTTNDRNGSTFSESIELPEQPERVWELFADPVLVERWLGAGSIVELVPGGSVVTPDIASGQPKIGRVDTIDVARRLEFTWSDTGAAGPSPERRVTFELEPTETGTRLTVTEASMNTALSATTADAWSWRFALFAVAASLAVVR